MIRNRFASHGCPGASILSASIAVYRPQAETFGGRCDGKVGVVREKFSYFQVPTRTGDN
jgi:hypothetical protein